MIPINSAKFLLLLAGLALTAGSASAAAISFQEGVSPTGTYNHGATYIRSGSPGNGLPQDGDLDVELIVGPTIGDVVRGLFEFDVSAIPSGDQIDSASLVLTTHASSVGIGGTQTFNLYSYNFDIDETTATWNTPDNGGSDVAGGTFGTLLNFTTFDVTQNSLTVTFGDSAAFQTAVSNAHAGDGFLRLILANTDESLGSHKFARFQPDNSVTSGARPELIVTHSPIPEPSAAALLGLAGLALMLRRRN